MSRRDTTLVCILYLFLLPLSTQSILLNNGSSVLFCNSLWIAFMEIIVKGHLVLPLTSNPQIFEILFLKDFHNCNDLKFLGNPFSVGQPFPWSKASFFLPLFCYSNLFLSVMFPTKMKIADPHSLRKNPSLKTIKNDFSSSSSLS